MKSPVQPAICLCCDIVNRWCWMVRLSGWPLFTDEFDSMRSIKCDQNRRPLSAKPQVSRTLESPEKCKSLWVNFVDFVCVKNSNGLTNRRTNKIRIGQVKKKCHHTQVDRSNKSKQKVLRWALIQTLWPVLETYLISVEVLNWRSVRPTAAYVFRTLPVDLFFSKISTVRQTFH